MSEQLWWSIEVMNGPFSADRWRDAHGEALMTAAFQSGSREWDWVSQPWGLVFEVSFTDIDGWTAFRQVPSVRAALDQVPDQVSGLFVHRGRGGTDPAMFPARPRPVLGAGGAALPIPTEELILTMSNPIDRLVLELDAVA
jgi:hypothetical protein